MLGFWTLTTSLQFSSLFFNISPRYQWYSYPQISSALTSNKTSLDTGKTKYAIKAWQYILADYINNPNSDRGVASRLVNKRDKINECNFGKFVLVLFDHDDFYLCSFSRFKLIKLDFFSGNFLAEEKKRKENSVSGYSRIPLFKFLTVAWYVTPLPERKENQSTKRNFLYFFKLRKLLRIYKMNIRNFTLILFETIDCIVKPWYNIYWLTFFSEEVGIYIRIVRGRP